MEVENIINKIHCADSEIILKEFPDSFIDLVVTSPPYNVDLGNNKYNKRSYDLYNDNKDHKEYILWLKRIFSEIYRTLVSSGRVIINVGDGKNGAVPTSSDIIQMMKEIGFIPYTHIIWNKFQVTNRTSWGSFLSPSCPSFPTPFEHIMVFCKDSKKLLKKGETDLTKEEFVEYSLSLWSFNPENRQKVFGHVAMFPEELVKRCLKMFSYIGATVLDPFNGAGTTSYVSKCLNRNYIGIEISSAYCDIALKRIKEAEFVNQ